MPSKLRPSGIQILKPSKKYGSKHGEADQSVLAKVTKKYGRERFRSNHRRQSVSSNLCRSRISLLIASGTCDGRRKRRRCGQTARSNPRTMWCYQIRERRQLDNYRGRCWQIRTQSTHRRISSRSSSVICTWRNLTMALSHSSWKMKVTITYKDALEKNRPDVHRGFCAHLKRKSVADDDGVRRLVNSVDDDSDRRLLYRLCLVQGTFVVDIAVMLAAAHEPLDRPRERIAQLAGPWLQKLAGGRFLTSPLVRPLAMTELPFVERRSIWNELASEIMRRQSKSVLDVAFAVGYLKNAEAYDRACAFLLVAFRAARFDCPMTNCVSCSRLLGLMSRCRAR